MEDFKSNYVLNAESGTEKARLLDQGEQITKTMRGPLPTWYQDTTLPHISSVVDLGCGPGEWVLAMARAFSHVRVIGVDISRTMTEYAQAQAAIERRLNATFRRADITMPPLPFADNSIDLVNMRSLTLALVPTQWPALLQDIGRILKPGGYVRWTESEMGFTNSPSYNHYARLFTQALFKANRSFSPDGFTLGIYAVMPSLLRTAGFGETTIEGFVQEGSYGTPSYHETMKNARVTFYTLQAFLHQMHAAPPEEIEASYQQVLDELAQPTFSATNFFFSVWAQKTDENSEPFFRGNTKDR